MDKLNPKLKDALEWICCIIFAIVVIFLIRFFIGTQTVVKQISMYPTLEQDQRLWLNRWGRTIHALPKRGEIITFEEPTKTRYNESDIELKNPVAKFQERTGWDWFVNTFLEIGEKRSYIKRVIGLPGEHVQIKDGKVYIDGKELQEDYLQPGVVTDVRGVGFDDFIVPENCVFAMGDNRKYSVDCRAFGCIPLEKIESTVAFRFWPLDKFGGID
ncbi:MAG: signal peptidase I [Clostridia bacterium]|nr:signal peptidase I [Clostridia bacterium]